MSIQIIFNFVFEFNLLFFRSVCLKNRSFFRLDLQLFYICLQGIVVTKVNPDGPAQGTLRPGDKILEVDGIDFTKSDHENAVAVLRATGAIVSMMISRHQ